MMMVNAFDRCEPRVGDLVATVKSMACYHLRLEPPVLVARPISSTRPTPFEFILEKDDYGTVVSVDDTARMLGVLVGDNVISFWPEYLRVIQGMEDDTT